MRLHASGNHERSQATSGSFQLDARPLAAAQGGGDTCICYTRSNEKSNNGIFMILSSTSFCTYLFIFMSLFVFSRRLSEKNSETF